MTAWRRGAIWALSVTSGNYSNGTEAGSPEVLQFRPAEHRPGYPRLKSRHIFRYPRQPTLHCDLEQTSLNLFLFFQLFRDELDSSFFSITLIGN